MFPNRTLTALTVSLVLTGCFFGGSRPKGQNPSSDTPEEASGPPPLFAGNSPTVPKAYGPLTIGMSKEDAAKHGERYVKSGSIGEKRYPNISFFVTYEDDTLRRFWLSFDEGREKSALEQASKAWGDPLVGEHLDRPVHAWFNDTTGLIATIEDTKMEYAPYILLGDLLGDEEPFLQPLLGKTKKRAREPARQR